MVCKDQFHGRYLGATPPESEDFQETVCQAHVKCCSFSSASSTHLAVTRISAEDDGLLLCVDRTDDQEVIKSENEAH